ncbi:glycosyltransferase family 4 protein [Tellurirhabdus bombi]|uniref:glycosyltransferase family 4 protein n=1 Tax=Tellurirhabdus bombi TaxID=2907205 RepID=UPI001F45E780|nr:glycosyltransferase family 4 protein [Tellurirhabdus bombi]
MTNSQSHALTAVGPSNVAFIGDYLPRRCGIATFTADLYKSFTTFNPNSSAMVVAVNDLEEGYDYPEEVRYEFYQHDLSSYRKAAEFLNAMNVEVVCLQHEYGIYGGTAGNYILTLLRSLNMPVITTFHTVLKNPDKDQLMTLKSIADVSARVVVMSEKGKQFLRDIYEIPEDKIDLIPHGIPDMPFVDPHFHKDRFGIEGKQVLLTFGLLSPNKGIENVIKALPKIVNQFSNVVYIVLGATHPNLVREHGEVYRDSLKQLASECGVSNNVLFYNQFVDHESLLEFLGAADIYITPYLNPAQITSGTLSYAFGVGKAVVSTPYWHAEELLADGRGVLVPFGDSEAIANEIINLLSDEPLRHAMRKRGYMMGREMIWERVMELYGQSFTAARYQPIAGLESLVPYLDGTAPDSNGGSSYQLPPIRLDHLYRLSDSTGIIQHARYHLPHYEEGYCTDDNARALILTIMLAELGVTERRIGELEDTYAAFLNYACSDNQRQFRNFMSYDRRWLEEVGSDDSTGRAIWALGTCIGRSSNKNLVMWAIPILHRTLQSVVEMQSPRSWAFALLGICEYQKRFSNDRKAKALQQQLIEKMKMRFADSATEDWPWFEHYLVYDNAVLPQALLRCGEVLGCEELIEIGLRSLNWLMKEQTAEGGHFQPIGSNGFYTKGAERAYYDQQPLEAQSTIAACMTAYRVTKETRWISEALQVFKWFTGYNDFGLSIYDQQTGGCRDGLQIDRVNKNQGAESTLSYLLALTELHLMQKHISETEPANSAFSMMV